LSHFILIYNGSTTSARYLISYKGFSGDDNDG